MAIIRKSGVISESHAMPNPIPASVQQQWYEEYNNHTGTADNVAIAATGGTGTSAETVSTHSRDLDAGLTANNYANWYINQAILFSTRRLVFNARILSPVTGDNTESYVYLGFSSTLTAHPTRMATFRQNANGSWQCVTDDGTAGETATSITAPATGDLLTIVATSTAVEFFVNGTRVAMHTTHIPVSDAMYPRALVRTDISNGTISRKINIDYIGFKRYGRVD